MRYPVTQGGSKQEFEADWYVASGFGEARKNSQGVVTYYHEGLDVNLNSGGNTDFNQELKAIANGRITYYHNFHSGTANTFGRHLVYKIDGPWGTRWVHYAHCNDLDFHGAVQDVTEGQVIARVGNSGTGYAHLHWAIFKVDPLAFGIDNIANNLGELNDYWENPQTFVDTWMVAPPVTDIRLSLLDQAGILTEGDTRRAIDRDRNYPGLEAEKNNLQNKINAVKQIVQ